MNTKDGNGDVEGLGGTERKTDMEKEESGKSSGKRPGKSPDIYIFILYIIIIYKYYI